MIITDKEKMTSLYMDGVIRQNSVITLEIDDYKDFKKIGDDNFAISVSGKDIFDAFNKLKDEMPDRCIDFINALILYIKGKDITMAEMDIVNDFTELFKDDVYIRWGGGLNDEIDTGVSILLFAFVEL